jgi:hypothetical protein
MDYSAAMLTFKSEARGFNPTDRPVVVHWYVHYYESETFIGCEIHWVRDSLGATNKEITMPKINI